MDFHTGSWKKRKDKKKSRASPGKGIYNSAVFIQCSFLTAWWIQLLSELHVYSTINKYL